MLKTRIITALVGIPILLGLLYLGGNYWRGAVLLLAGIALLEYTAMMHYQGFKPLIIPAGGIGLVLLFRGQLDHYLAGLFFAGWLLMVLFVVINYPRFNFMDLALSFFGAFYCGYLLSYALALPELQGAYLNLLLCLVLTWASDIGGYLFGTLWGNYKLAPQLSPGKTREGAIGAVILTIIVAVSFKYIFSMEYLSLFYTILLGICVSGAAQLGDLLESALKRYFGVKDSGRIIPGHGGVLDRFDSLMLVLPVVYYFMVLFG
jgi:phosphatidate cytidylyltransferase